jgi:RimJ/RimL family protein N-acetyltransferase
MIETERLFLAPPSLADFTESCEMASDPEIVRFIGGKPATREDAWTKLLRNIGHWSAFGYGLFVVRERVGNAFVGEVGLAHFGRGIGDMFDPFPEAAWVLSRRAQGRGYATEAVKAAHDWLTSRKACRRTVCLIHPDNSASIRVAERLGYRAFGQCEYRGATPTNFERLG